MSDTLDRAKAQSGNTYTVLLVVQGIAESMAQNDLREFRFVGKVLGDPLTVEAKR